MYSENKKQNNLVPAVFNFNMRLKHNNRLFFSYWDHGIAALFIYLSVCLFIYLGGGGKVNRHSLLQKRSVFWEAQENNWRLLLLLSWGATSCLHYSPKFKMLPCPFPTQDQVHTLRLCLISCHGGPPPSSRISQILNQSQLVCLLEPKTWGLSPVCCPRVLFTLGQAYFFGKISLSGGATLGQHFLRYKIPNSENRPFNLIDTHSCQPSLVLIVL